MSVENNGPSNIVTFIRIYKLQNPTWASSAELAILLNRIEREAWDTIEYMRFLENPTAKMWHDIKKGE
jgi:hypothetical protein